MPRGVCELLNHRALALSLVILSASEVVIGLGDLASPGGCCATMKSSMNSCKPRLEDAVDVAFAPVDLRVDEAVSMTRRLSAVEIGDVAQ